MASVAAAALAVALAAPAHALAASELAASVEDLRDGPSLADERVSWLELGRSGYGVRAAAPGQRPNRLLTPSITPLDAVERERLAFSTSRSRVVFSRLVDVCPRALCVSTKVNLQSAAHGAAPAPVVECQSGATSLHAHALEGDTLAFVDCARALHVRDLRAGGQDRVVRNLGPLELPSVLDLAGRYLARLESSSGRAVVQDLASGQDVYRVPGRYADLALSGDGTVALIAPGPSPERCDEALALASPSSPAPRFLPGSFCGEAIAAAGPLVVAITEGRRGQRLLVTVDRGGTQRPAAALGPRDVQVGSFDGEGRHAAYALRRCDARFALLRVDVADFDPAAPVPAEPASCPLRLGRKARLRRGRAVLRFTCPRGCAGRVSLSARVSGRRARIGRARVKLAPSRRVRVVRVRLSSRARRALAARGGLAARATLTVSDRRGSERRLRRRTQIVK